MSLNRRSFFGLLAAAFVAPVGLVKALLEKRPRWFNKTTGLTCQPASSDDHRKLMDAIQSRQGACQREIADCLEEWLWAPAKPYWNGLEAEMDAFLGGPQALTKSVAKHSHPYTFFKDLPDAG